MSGKRRKTPTVTETDVLTKSGRRCALCFGLLGDNKVKQGQIAHVDHNPANHAFDNLVWLCFDHHDAYDTRTSQSKGFTQPEVKRYRDSLYSAMPKILADGRHPESQGVGRSLEQCDIELLAELGFEFPRDEVYSLFKILERPRYIKDIKDLKRRRESIDRYLEVDKRFTNVDLETSKTYFLQAMHRCISLHESRLNGRASQEEANSLKTVLDDMRTLWDSFLSTVRELEPAFSWPDKNPSLYW